MSADPAQHVPQRDRAAEHAPMAASRPRRGPGRSVAPEERGAGAAAPRGAALIALIAGGLASLLLAAALLDPGHAATPLLLALLTLALGGAVALALRLRHERAAAAALAARLERLEDEKWETEEARAGIPTGDVASGFEPALSIATVSHELRAPLHGMHGLTDLLAETELSAEQRAYVEALGQSTEALGRVVEDLLDASRIATGHFSLERQPTAIEPLIEQIAELMAPRAFAKGLGLSTRATRGLPPLDVDAGRLRQVLINLVTNAISFSDSGGIVLAADEVQSAEGRIRMRFSVADTGRGVAPADRTRIFANFERGTGDGAGAGLGLAISSRIVERMGASLTLSPRPGDGSIFAFELELAAMSSMTTPPAMLAGRRIVVALRSEPERQALAAAIEAEGGEAILAGTEAAAAGLLGAAAAAGQSVDSLLIDIQLLADPEASPERLRDAAGARLPIAVLIEPAGRQRLPALREAGFDAYLVRPVRNGSLLRVVATLAGAFAGFVIDPADTPADPRERRGRSPLRTLVVEDDPVGALLIRAVLEKLGHDVVEARGLAAARSALLGRGADLVIVDMRLGAEDGLTLIRELRAAPRGPLRPVCIAMSADDAALEAAAVAAGADLAIAKPLSPDSLRHAVAAACGSGAA